MRKRESHSHEMDLSRDYLQDLGYEPRDVSLPILVKWLVILFVFMAAMAAVSYGVYWLFVAEEPNQGARTLDVNMRKVPQSPNPLLQGFPLDDINKFRDKEAQHLDNYHWKDRAKGIATMPVDKALEIVAEKGLPTKGRPGQAAPGQSAPTGMEVTPQANPIVTPGAGAAPTTGGEVPLRTMPR